MKNINRNQYRKIQPWARDALVRSFESREVMNGIARCIAEQRVLIVQLLKRPTTGRVTVIQHPQSSVQAAYEWLNSKEAIPSLPHNDYFIVASAEALQQAEVDGVPYWRTIRRNDGSNGHQAEILRVPVQEANRA